MVGSALVGTSRDLSKIRRIFKETTSNKIMRTVVFYENTADATMEKLMEFFPQHQENEDKFVKAGKVIGIGPFSIPGHSDSELPIVQPARYEDEPTTRALKITFLMFISLP